MFRTPFTAGALAALALAAATTSRAAAQQVTSDRRPTLAVMYFNNSSMVDHGSYDAVSKGIADILITDLATVPTIRVIERDQLQKLLDEQNLTAQNRVDQETAVRVGKLLGAQHMIVGGFFVDLKGQLRLDARAVNVETSAIEHVETVSGKSEDILAVIADLSGRLAKGLKLPGNPAPARPAGDTPKSGRFQALVLYSRALTEDDKRNVTEAVNLYQQFLDGTPANFAVDQRTRAQARLRELKKSGE